jgi:SAM-dependent methyltransferase
MTGSKVSSAGEGRLGALWAAAWQSIPDPIARMLSDGGWALEVGCGAGLACLALAEAIPRARVIGHDEDAEAIARARALARAAGLDGRLSFYIDDSRKLPRATFHLVTAEELRARHAEPRRVLNAIRNALVPDGACLLLEPPRPLPTRVPDIDLQSLAWQTGFSRFRPVPSEGPLRLFELRR